MIMQMLKNLSMLLLMAAAMMLLAECKSTPKEEANDGEEVVIEETVIEDADNARLLDELEAITPVEGKAEAGAVAFDLVEVKPGFMEGNADDFAKWVNENIQYPEEARDREAQGRVVLQFTVEPDGSLSDIKVLKSPDEALSAEAVRVVSESPKWTPGYMNGEAVKVTYNFPVVFKLK